MGVTTAAKDGPWHSWAVVACTGMSIGHKGMIYASKSLAMTMLDFYKNPKLNSRGQKKNLQNEKEIKYMNLKYLQAHQNLLIKFYG